MKIFGCYPTEVASSQSKMFGEFELIIVFNDENIKKVIKRQIKKLNK